MEDDLNPHPGGPEGDSTDRERSVATFGMPEDIGKCNKGATDILLSQRLSVALRSSRQDIDKSSAGGPVLGESTSSTERSGAGVAGWKTHKGTLSVAGAAVSLFTIVFGAAIVFVPCQSKEVGLVPALGLNWLCTVLVIYSGMRMTQSFVWWNALRFEKMTNYEHLGLHSFGSPGLYFAQGSVVVFLFGLGALYLILIADQGVSFLKLFVESAGEWGMKEKRIALVVTSPIAIVLSMFQNLSALEKLTWAAAIAGVTCILVIIIQACIASSSTLSWKTPDDVELRTYFAKFSAKSLGSCACSFLGTFGVNIVFPSIMMEMENPSDFNKVLLIVLPAVGVVYSLIIWTTWLGYGNFNQQNVLETIKFMPNDVVEAFQDPKTWTGPESKAATCAFNVCLFFNIMVSFPLLQLGMFKSMQGLLPECLQDGGIMQRIGVRSTVLVAEFSLAILAINGIFPVFDFFAGLCLPIQSIIIPIFFCGTIIRNLENSKFVPGDVELESSTTVDKASLEDRLDAWSPDGEETDMGGSTFEPQPQDGLFFNLCDDIKKRPWTVLMNGFSLSCAIFTGVFGVWNGVKGLMAL